MEYNSQNELHEEEIPTIEQFQVGRTRSEQVDLESDFLASAGEDEDEFADPEDTEESDEADADLLDDDDDADLDLGDADGSGGELDDLDENPEAEH